MAIMDTTLSMPFFTLSSAAIVMALFWVGHYFCEKIIFYANPHKTVAL